MNSYIFKNYSKFYHLKMFREFVNGHQFNKTMNGYYARLY